MKRLVSILLATLLLITVFTGCRKKQAQNSAVNNGEVAGDVVSGTTSQISSGDNANTSTTTTVKGYDIALLYEDINLSEYVTLSDYSGIEIDKNSVEFKNIYTQIRKNDIYDFNLYNTIKEGTVVNGDIVNLDYEGKIDGVAFEGGTAKGYNLEIGSNTFIDDFEEELIGAKVGETKDVTAKFPSNYHAAELAGKEAVFTCTVNSIQRGMTEAEAFSKMSFKTEADYKNDITNRAAKECILDTVCEKSKIAKYPEYYVTVIGDAIYEYYTYIFQTQYNQNLDDVLSGQQLDKETFKSDLAEDMMYSNMVMYSIFFKENLELDKKFIDEQSINQPIISQSYAVQEAVLSLLLEKAIIK